MTSHTTVRLVALASLTLAAGVAPAVAQQGDWQVRWRVAAVTSSNDSAPVADLGTVLTLDTGPGLTVDASYGLTHALAASLALTGSYHSMTTEKGLAGGLTAGTLWLGSATLTLQYRPPLMGAWHPYFGAGLSYSQPFGFNLDDEAAAVGLRDIGFDGELGSVLQAGVMYDLSEWWFLDLGVTRYTLTTHASLTVDPGLHYTTVDMDLDPWQVGLGVGRRF